MNTIEEKRIKSESEYYERYRTMSQEQLTHERTFIRVLMFCTSESFMFWLSVICYMIPAVLFCLIGPYEYGRNILCTMVVLSPILYLIYGRRGNKRMREEVDNMRRAFNSAAREK